MKILWFTGTPALAEEIKGVKGIYGGGWIKSLQSALKDYKIELGIAFYSRHLSESFKHEGTNYYPIDVKRPLYTKVLNRLFPSIEPIDDVKIYKNIVEQFSPDLIHIHGTELSFGLVQKFFPDIPTVVSIQGIITVYDYKFYDGIPKRLINKHSSFFQRLFNLNFNYLKRIFELKLDREQEILKMTRYVIGRTDWDRRVSSILAPNSCYFHNDEIIRNVFYKVKWVDPKNEKFVIYSTNANTVYKGLESIIKATELLNQQGINFTWKIGGVSENDEMVKLSKKIMKLKHTSNIEFLGKLNEDEILNNLLGCNLYVMTSHIENSPNNLVESMILGVPSIASHAGGTDNLLKNKISGILIQNGDPWVLAGAIKEVMVEYSKAKDYGHEARKISLERNDPIKICQDLVNIYDNIIENH